MVDSDTIRAALAHPLDHTSAVELGLPADTPRYEGKVRDNYTLPGGRRLLVTTDRISAFDRVLTTIPFKGQVLNRLAAFWFEATKEVAPNHLLAMPDPSAIVGVDCTALPVELVVRAYLTGVTSTSIWTHYAAGARTFAGHALPDGLSKNDPLPAAIVTPSTKAEKGGHDVTVSREELLAGGRIDAATFDRAAEMALRLFAAGQARAAARGLVLVDTKYEVGLDAQGELRVIDEIHTPDSSRYWVAGTIAERRARGEEPESLDKEYVRRWLADQGFVGEGPIPPIPDDVRVEAARRYIAAYEAIVGEAFVPDVAPPLPRLRAALAGI